MRHFWLRRLCIVALFGWGALAGGIGFPADLLRVPLRPDLAQSLPLIGVDVAHGRGITGRGVGVAVIDNFTPNPNDPCNDFAHGDWVSGVLEAVAPGAQVHRIDVPLDVPGEDGRRCFGFSAAALSLGLDTALRNVERWGLKVVNYSIGGGRFEDWCDEGGAIADVVRQLAAQGVVFVTAAGNQGYTDALGFPECMRQTLSVGAVYDYTDATPEVSSVCSDTPVVDKVTCYSNSAYFLDVLAPGSWITVNSRLSSIGTSAAAPHVAGVVAMMLQIDPNLTLDEIRDVLNRTGKRVTDHRNGKTFPRVDAARAVDWLLARQNHAPQVTLSAQPEHPTSQDTLTFAATATDPDGDALSWSWWVDGAQVFDAQEPTLRWERPAPGTYHVAVRASDGRGGVGEATLTLEVVDIPTALPLYEALDANHNRVLDDEEVLEAVRLWITHQPAPGGQTVDDDGVLDLVAHWVSALPF